VKRKTSEEHDRFTNLVSELLKVPHSEIKAKLDQEKKVKNAQKKQKKISHDNRD
jgi:hypothetical protein